MASHKPMGEVIVGLSNVYELLSMFMQGRYEQTSISWSVRWWAAHWE